MGPLLQLPEENLYGQYRLIKNICAVDNRTFEMSQGQKKRRFVAWTFMSKEQRRVCGKR
jgi:23S rRNA (adenine1618-N6)-methyltransferase